MFNARTDMAVERRSDLTRQDTADIEGLIYNESREGDIKITDITVSSEEASVALGKPYGQYITLDLGQLWQNDNDLIIDIAHKLAHKLSPLTEGKEKVLIVGLGNRYITPDALGPLALEKVIVTRHLIQTMPEIFDNLRDVAAFAPGVMGQTGMEVFELVKGACENIKPSLVIAIDALAARSLARLGCSFQISTAGIIPGEGAGNRRFALSEETLGVPVISIGVPTVAEASTLVYDLAGVESGDDDMGRFLVSPSDIDMLIAKSAKAVGYGINLALQGDMPISDMEQMLL